MDIDIILILLISGLVVGFLNTLAGGATIISMAVFMSCGLPIIQAAGTNRIAVLMQNIVSTFMFRRQKLIDLNHAFKLSIPILIGTLIGTQFTMHITNGLYSVFFIGGVLFLGIMLIVSPLTKKNIEYTSPKQTTPLLWILLFLAGIYSGSIYVGVGYIFIAIFVVGYGVDLIRANALKGFMAMILTPVSLLLFIYHSEVNYQYGLVHGLGNIAGAYVGSHYAKRLGVGFIRIVLIVMIIVSLVDLIRKPFFLEYIKNILY